MEDQDRIKDRPTDALTALYQLTAEADEKAAAVSNAWEMTFKSINELVSIHDKDFNLVYVNDAFADTFKKRSRELVGKKCYEVIHGMNAPTPHCPHKQTLLNQEPATEEFYEPKLERYLQVSTSPIFDEKGEFIGSVHIAKDITERKKAEVEMRLHSEIVANMCEGVNLVRADDCRIVYTNPKFDEMFGYGHNELLGKHISIVNSPAEKDPRHTVNEIIDALNTDGVWEGEIQIIRKDGTPFWCYASVSMFNHDHYGKVFLSVHTDITERKQIEDRIKRINRLKEDLISPRSLDEKLRRITDGIIDIFDADFARIWVSKSGDLCDAGCFHSRAPDGPHACPSRDRCLHLIASSGRYTHIDGEVHRRVPVGCYKIGRVASGEISRFITNDVTHDPYVHDHEWADKLGLRSFAGYRLLSEDRNTVGVLALFSKHIISPNDALLEGIANTTAHVIQTAKAEEALRESEESARVQLKAKVKERTAELESVVERLQEGILERREIEEALKQKNIELNSFINNIPDMAWLMDVNSRFIAANKAFAEAVGMDTASLINRGYGDCFGREKAGRYRKDDIKIMKTKKQKIIEEKVVNKESNEAWLETIKSPMLNESGKVVGTVGVARNITERKRTVERLQETEKKLRIHSKDLRESNIALKVLLKHRENDRKDFEKNILSNMKYLIFPYITKLKKRGGIPEELVYLKKLESNLKDIVSPFSHKLSSKYLGFTPKEIQIADLIKDGRKDKDIMEILHISPDTVKTHRKNIRKKLGIQGKNINLRTKLLSL